MAQKKESRTQEMQLAAAKIPAEAWPYALPEGWTWVRLGKIFEVNPKNKADDATMASFITMADIAAGMVSEFQTTEKMWGEIRKGHTQFADGDVAFAKISPCFENRKSMIVRGLKNGIGAGTTELIVLRSPFFDPRFVFYLISTEDFIHRGVATYRGVVGQQRINMNFVKEYPVPLPPMDEQKRIVRRIESLFSKLDVVAEKIDAADAAFVAQKNALLHAAFDGTLTEAWREKNGTDRSWTMTPIKALCKRLQYGTAKKSEKAGKLPVVRMGNLQDGEILWDDLVYSNDEDDIKKYLLHDGDVLFNRTNSAALVGKTSIYRGQQPAIFAGYLIRLDYDKERILGDFLNYALNTVDAKNYCHQVKVDGVNQSNINAQKIGAYQIPLPPLSEQHEIVRRLDALLGRLARARAAVGEARAQIASLRTSILARAFRGEL